jgi:glutamine amidotransferase
MIGIIDYGMGNVGSIQNFFEYQGFENEVIDNPNNLFNYKFIILPGIGSFDKGVELLKNSGFWSQLLLIKSHPKVQLLGICLGMQLLTKGSEEGNSEGLGFIDTVCKKFKPKAGIRIPHMGWNMLKSEDSGLMHCISEHNRFYFVHSYYVDLIPETFLTTSYGENFSSGIKLDNVMGLQFHPEKSHVNGMKLIEYLLKPSNDKTKF